MNHTSMHKNAALPGNIQIPLDATETQIFNFIRAACDDIGSIVGQRPTARVTGGWVLFDKFRRSQIIHDYLGAGIGLS